MAAPSLRNEVREPLTAGEYGMLYLDNKGIHQHGIRHGELEIR